MSKLFQPEETQLSNGIPVILQHYDGAVAACYWWIRTGSCDESPKEAGFAHFLEHMLFKDAAAKETGKASTGQLARAVESLGGDINAYTSFDQTVYHVTCAAHHWERVLDSFGEMAKPQHFLKGDFEREREVILEELRKNEDSPGRQLFQKMFSQTFSRHPYGKPVIGFVKTLKAAKVGELEAFYRRSYVPEKMGLIMVGPIDDVTGARKKGILKILEKRYGSKVLPRRPGKAHPRAIEPELRKAPFFSTLPFDVKTPTLGLTFRVPHLEHPDVPALDLMAGVLGMGELSRLYQRLFYQTSLATEASGGMYIPKDPGMLYFQAEVNSIDKLRPAAEALFDELHRLQEEGPTAEELRRVLVNAESERLYSTQTADGMAGRLGFLKFVMGDLDFDQRYLGDLRAVDSARVREVARQYLDPRRMAGVVQVPQDQKSYDSREIMALGTKAIGVPHPVPAAKPAASAKKRKGPAPVETITLPSGIRVVHYERTSSHVFSAHASMLGGLRLELARPVTTADQDWGASHMMALTWTKGTPTRDAHAISGIVEGSAASLDGFSGRNSVGLQITGLARDWAKLSAVFSEALVEPSFPDDEVGHSRRVSEESIRSIEDHSGQLCSKLFLETLFEKHPYGRITTGSLESLAKIDSQRLKSFHRKWLRPDRLVLAVSGNVSRGHLDTWLEELEARVRANPVAGPAVDGGFGAVPEEPALVAPRWVEKTLNREQSHILVGGLGLKINSPERHALRILTTLLGGQSGRLFIELREKKSLAYTVSPLSFEGMERGYVGTYIACSPGKREEALAGIRMVLETLARKGPTAAEMSRACEFYLGRRAMELQSDSSLAAHFGLETLYDLGHPTEAEIVKRIRSVTPRDVQKVCRDFLIEPHMVTSVVG